MDIRCNCYTVQPIALVLQALFVAYFVLGAGQVGESLYVCRNLSIIYTYRFYYALVFGYLVNCVNRRLYVNLTIYK